MLSKALVDAAGNEKGGASTRVTLSDRHGKPEVVIRANALARLGLSSAAPGAAVAAKNVLARLGKKPPPAILSRLGKKAPPAVLARLGSKVGSAAATGAAEGSEDGVRLAGTDFIKYLDDEGTPYYYHVGTQETQWEVPVVAKLTMVPRTAAKKMGGAGGKPTILTRLG